MKNIIFYFSATGNSLQAANDIAEALGECAVVSMAGYEKSSAVTAERVGFVFPVYHWGLPNLVKVFLKEIRPEEDSYIFAAVTCGGEPGTALQQADALLRLHNGKLHSGFITIMPTNYILLYEVESRERQAELFEKERLKAQEIAGIIRSKKVQELEKSGNLAERLGGKLINSMAAGRYPGRDSGFRPNNSCTGCGLCEKTCKVNNITMVNGRPSWNHHCEFCLGCLHHCPAKAIDYKNVTQKKNRYLNPNVKI